MPTERRLPAVTENRNYPQPVKYLKPMALSPTPAYRLLDLYFADYAAASAAAAEAGALVGATLEHATGGVVIAFAEVLDDA